MALTLTDYQFKANGKTILDIPHITLHRGAVTVIQGPSGAGKSTLLYGLAGIDFNQGSLTLDNESVDLTSALSQDRYRRDRVGLIFQNIHLLPALTVLQNVTMPFNFNHVRISNYQKDQAIALLNRFDIQDHDQKVSTLSRGEQQRVAIARALVTEPDILLADEPTASLDEENTQLVQVQLREIAIQGKIVVVVSHDPIIIENADQVITLNKGKLV